MSAFDTLYNLIYPALFESAVQPELASLACALVTGFATVLVFALPFYCIWRFTAWIGSGLN